MIKNYILILSVLSVGTLHAQQIRYVKVNGTGNGTSWADASGNLQTMINQSSAGDKVYVAEGTYIPSEKAAAESFEWLTNNPRGATNDRAKSIVLKDGVKVYGGFSATSPVTDLSQRNFDVNETIITTDILGNDIGFSDLSTYSDNYWHAVIAAGLTSNQTVFDGFTLKGGTAAESNDYDYILVNGTQVQQRHGGAITIVEANISVENIKVTKTGKPIYVKTATAAFKNIDITHSFYQFDIQGANVTIENMNFSDNIGNLNIASNYDLPNESFVKLKNVTFSRNPTCIDIWRDAQKNATVEIDRAKFNGNFASNQGIVRTNGADLKMSNIVATGNTSGNQSGFLNINTLNQSIITKVEVVNSTFVSNKSNFDWNGYTGAITGGSATNAHVKIRNSIIWGNKLADKYENIFATGNPNFTVSNSIIQDAFDASGTWNPKYGINSGGNSDTMPNFTQYIGINTTAFDNGDFSLAAGSPGIDGGDNNAYNTLVGANNLLDVTGNSRFMGTSIDIGAYEFLDFLSTEEFNSKKSIKVYPNPATDWVKIDGLQESATYTLVNSIGQVLLKGKIQPSKDEISIGHLENGIYFLQLETKNNKLVQKIIKK